MLPHLGQVFNLTLLLLREETVALNPFIPKGRIYSISMLSCGKPLDQDLCRPLAMVALELYPPVLFRSTTGQFALQLA